MFKLLNRILDLLNWILGATAALVAFLMVAATFTKFAKTPPWVAGVALGIVSFVLYLGSATLIRLYIMKRTPELANDESWELTAGTGIVPKWVSLVGLLAIPAFAASALWFAKWYWPD